MIIAQLYKITCLLNNKAYIGMVWAKNKTYEDRFKEHIEGKRGCGKYIHAAICQHGKENFKIELLEEGSFEYIWNREIEESKKTLYHTCDGYNGNCGRAIFNSPETIKKINEKRTLKREITISKFKNTVKRDFEKHSKRRKELLRIIKESNPNKWKEWHTKQGNSLRNRSKNTHNSCLNQSISMRKTAKNPTEKMLLGNKKRSDTLTGRRGSVTSGFRGWYHTPMGVFESISDCSATTGLGRTAITRLCYADIAISGVFAYFLSRVPFFKGRDIRSKTSLEWGFRFEPK